jgi:hypothetical protein
MRRTFRSPIAVAQSGTRPTSGSAISRGRRGSTQANRPNATLLTLDSMRALRQETSVGRLPGFQVLRALCFLAQTCWIFVDQASHVKQ